MKISYKWAIALALVLSTGFVGCNKDEDDPKITPEEAYNELIANGNDRIYSGLLGAVKTFTEVRYSDASYVNNTIHKGNIIQQSVTEFNSAGFVTKETYSENIPTACKWSKDKIGNNIIVVTARTMQTKSTVTYQYDQTKPYRVTEIIENGGEYKISFGDVEIYDFSYRDTCWYWNGTANVNNTQFSSNLIPEKIKKTYSYDDANKKATEIESEFDTDKNEYVDVSKTVYDINQWDRIDYSSYEQFPAETKSFDTQFESKRVVEYDAKGNKTKDHEIHWDSYLKKYSFYRCYEYSYTYF